jgi:putative transposase
MRRRRNADEVARLLRDADRDLAKGLTISDICRKQGIAETTYYRWRQRHAPDQVDTDRRCRELELEVDRLKRLVAELLLDKTMLQDIATSPVQERCLDLRLHPRPHGRGSFPQVANLGGRIYSGVLGVACGRDAYGSRCSADHGPGHGTSRGADSHQER